MPSKYDAFWISQLNVLRRMCADAKMRGYSKPLSLKGILNFGKRESWSGLTVIRGHLIVEARMAHAVSLAKVITNAEDLVNGKTTYRLVINEEPSLRIFRMNWKAQRINQDGRILNSLSVSQVAIIEELIRPICAHFSQNPNAEFHVSELAQWVKTQFPYIHPFTGDRGMKKYSQQHPEKNIIDLQNSCYHLSAPKSFWIESTDSGNKIDPLIRISKLQYRVKQDWKSRILGSIDVYLEAKPVSKPLLELYEVKPPPKSPIKKPVRTIQRGLGGTSIADYVEQATKNQTLGLAGEKFVMTIEQDKLKIIGKPELAAKVRHVSLIEGDFAGYDIRSFDEEGKEIYIEVKTTTKGESEAFYVTKNEIEVSKAKGEKYWLYRVFQFNEKTERGQFFRVKGAISKSFVLTPTLYFATR